MADEETDEKKTAINLTEILEEVAPEFRKRAVELAVKVVEDRMGWALSNAVTDEVTAWMNGPEMKAKIRTLLVENEIEMLASVKAAFIDLGVKVGEVIRKKTLECLKSDYNTKELIKALF